VYVRLPLRRKRSKPSRAEQATWRDAGYSQSAIVWSPARAHRVRHAPGGLNWQRSMWLLQPLPGIPPRGIAARSEILDITAGADGKRGSPGSHSANAAGAKLT